MNAKLKCSARIIGTPHGITLSKPEHNHEPIEYPEQKHKKMKEMYNLQNYVAHE